MLAATQAPTLYEDWQCRRERLAAGPLAQGDRRHAELRLLDFLLEYYCDSPVAKRPARFPARTELYVDRRAIVVLNHLGKGYMSDVHTRQQAETRVRAVLDRMAAPADSGLGDRPVFNPTTPRSYDEALDAVREGLCEGRPEMRLLSIVELGRYGTLDDIGLISDLLALPPQSDEDPYERHVLLTAMKKIVQRRTAKPATEESLSAVTACLPKLYEPLLLTFYAEPWRDGAWIVIGDDCGIEFRVDAAGAVYSVDPSGHEPNRFVNSSVEQLAKSLVEHREEIVALILADKSAQKAAIESYCKRLGAIDPKALANGENWWVIAVEHMLPDLNECGA